MNLIIEGMICRCKKAGSYSLSLWDELKKKNTSLVCPCALTKRYENVQILDKEKAIINMLEDLNTFSVVWVGDLVPRIKEGVQRPS
jgi:hypothetical protein